MSHGNSKNQNQVFARSKSSQLIQLEAIMTETKEKSHIVYKKKTNILILKI